MTEVTIYFWALALAIVVLGYSLTATKQALGFVVVAMLAAFVAIPLLLGLPASAPGVDGMRLISHHLANDRAIYVWAIEDGKPRYYQLPWDTKLAEQLQQAGHNKGKGRIKEYGLKRRDGKWAVDVTGNPLLPQKEAQ